jgi:DNA repair photolyase
MKEFKSPIRIPSGGETNRCFYPFVLDTYGCGCSNNCLYCYAKSALDFRKLWDEKDPAVSNSDYIRSVFENALTKNRGEFAELISARMPVRLGGMTDCFSDIEISQKRTYDIIQMLNEYDYPYLILTKNKLVADYIPILNPKNCIVQVSITTPFDDVSRIYEPGATVSSGRFEALRRLNDAGIYTAVRINPFFPVYEIDRNLAGRFRYFDWSIVDMIRESGTRSVIAGFARLSAWNLRWIRKATGINFRQLFDGAKMKNGALHFQFSEKQYYYEHLKSLCDKSGIEFSICYDDDRSYNKFRYLWANPDDCCNISGKVPGFHVKYTQFNHKFITDGSNTKNPPVIETGK